MTRTATQSVLNALERAKNKGISYKNFSPNFAIRSRISDLRKLGYDILTEKEYTNKTNWFARYVLVGSPSTFENCRYIK